jgi:mannan endo-1,4-beta-mannosidase
MKKVICIISFVLAFPSLVLAQGFTISGAQLLDANGNNFIIKGVNVPLAWFVTDVNNNIANIKNNTGVNTMRIVVTTSTADKDWQACVQKCIDNKVIPLVELHDVTGSDVPADLNKMAQFWASKASYLTQSNIAKYILINIANEWSSWYMSATATGTVSRVTWRDAYKTAVKTIRDAGIKTTLVCDAAGYGQDNKAQTLLAYAKDVEASDPYHNCLFSIHMYCEWSVGGNSSVTTHLPAVKNAGIPVIVGEFGWEESSGNGNYCNIDETSIINTCQSNGIGWIAWSWKGNGGVENVLDLSNDWAGANLTTWGKTVVNGTNGTKTGITATVFNSSSTCCGKNTSSGFAYCCTNSDPDGDGWGWENSASCVVPGSVADPDKCGSVVTFVENAPENQSPRLFPNPFTEAFNIQQEGRFHYSVLNSSGQVVESGEGEVQVRVGEALPKGMYLLQIDQAGQKALKIVKQ